MYFLRLLSCFHIVCLSTSLALISTKSKGAVHASSDAKISGAVLPNTPTVRPAFVQGILDKHYDSLNNDTNNGEQDDSYIYYFGLGSNMLRSKIENRGGNNSKIDIIEMEPAIVKGHRLSFNMRGFPPLEPAMGSLEPVDSDSKPILAYSEPECHGALVKLTPENYEKVMRSEGVSSNATNPGYEEVVITAIPYNSSKLPVQAVALRARQHTRLLKDGCPSERYMKILKQGALELNLLPNYQEFLNQHPVQKVPQWLKRVSINNLIFTMAISTLLKTRLISKIQSWLLFQVYARVDHSGTKQIMTSLSEVAMGLILLPGGLIGMIIRLVVTALKLELPPMVTRFMTLLEDSDAKKPEILVKEASNSTIAT